MKTDSIYYQLFLQFPSLLFELIGESSAKINNYKFESREIKDHSFRLDGLLFPEDKNSKIDPFYLVEFQSQTDDDLYYRIFAELFIFLRQYKPKNPWRIVIIYPSRSLESEDLAQFAELLNLERVTIIYLDEIDITPETSLGVELLKLIITPGEQSVEKAKILIDMAKEEIKETVSQKDLIDLIQAIIVYKLPTKSRKEIETMLGLSELKQTRVYQEALAEGREEGIQYGREEGIQIGREEGIQLGEQRGIKVGEKVGEQRGKKEGRQETKRKAILKMLDLGLNEETIAQSLDVSIKNVRNIAAKRQNH